MFGVQSNLLGLLLGSMTGTGAGTVEWSRCWGRNRLFIPGQSTLLERQKGRGGWTCLGIEVDLVQ